MKRKLFVMLAVLSVAAFATSAQSLQSLGKKKKLLWQDEFNGSGLPDSRKWNYEVGFVRNNEKQFYTREQSENAYLLDGHLVIQSRKENYDTARYTSASINTLDKKAFTGDFRIEVRAKLPFGKGIWPAIWMMGTNRKEVGWPKCSELDIMEFVGHTPNTVWGTLHWWDSTTTNPKHYVSKGSKLLFDDLHDNFHVYGLERKGSTVQLFVDSNYYFRFNVPPTAYPGSFTGPVYLLLNTAVGGSWGGEVDDSIFPQLFVVDYVRVYRLQ